LWLFCKSQALSTDRNEVMVCFFIEFLLVCVYVMIFMYICKTEIKKKRHGTAQTKRTGIDII
jgi:hypothetical protein